MYTYEYPRPALAVDIAVFTLREWEPCVLLIERGEEPFRGKWALPGGFVHENETVEEAANRELAEETGVRDARAVQCRIFSKPNRDPRGWVISLANFACVHFAETMLQAGSDAARAEWFSVHELPPLAFDHGAIIDECARTLSSREPEDPIFARMLAREFTLSDLQRVVEIVKGERIDKRNFRRTLEERGRVHAVGRKTHGPHRPAELYALRSE